jgi:hypothetical protein
MQTLFHEGLTGLPGGRRRGRKAKWPAPLIQRNGPFIGGRYWVRTSDLFGVNEARYHCANRPNAIEC